MSYIDVSCHDPHSGAGRARTVTPSVNMKEMNLRKTGVSWPVSGEGCGSSNPESAGLCSKESRTAVAGILSAFLIFVMQPNRAYIRVLACSHSHRSCLSSPDGNVCTGLTVCEKEDQSLTPLPHHSPGPKVLVFSSSPPTGEVQITFPSAFSAVIALAQPLSDTLQEAVAGLADWHG